MRPATAKMRAGAALEKGRKSNLLEPLLYPENVDNHCVVDLANFEFYAMDCYRKLGADSMAEPLPKDHIDLRPDLTDTRDARRYLSGWCRDVHNAFR